MPSSEESLSSAPTSYDPCSSSCEINQSHKASHSNSNPPAHCCSWDHNEVLYAHGGNSIPVLYPLWSVTYVHLWFWFASYGDGRINYPTLSILIFFYIKSYSVIK